jgi:hypothetical protein
MRLVTLLLVIAGAVGITALGIDAADTFTGSRTTLLASLMGSSRTELCPTGMVALKTEMQTICVDTYEAGVGSTCPVHEPHSVQDTLHNLQQSDCAPVSTGGALPWRYVPYRIAEQLCARAGKSLLSANVWYRSALGTPDAADVCSISESSVAPTGKHAKCISGIGVYDMVGNVWELVQGEVIDGALQKLSLPEPGYIAGVNDDGIPTVTNDIPNVLYGADYFWREASGTFAMMRGGFYNGQSDAGLYSIQAVITQDFAGEAVGFRCMQSL